MSEKKYRIDGIPVTSRELIEEAECVDDDFADDWLKSTSSAARILRSMGRTVDSNPEASA